MARAKKGQSVLKPKQFEDRTHSEIFLSIPGPKGKKKDLLGKASCSFLNLRASGLFCAADGNGIRISDKRIFLANLIREDMRFTSAFKGYILEFMNGSPIPTDCDGNLRDMVRDLISKIRHDDDDLFKRPVEDLSRDEMFELIEAARLVDEREYALRQSEEIPEIASLAKAVASGKTNNEIIRSRGRPATMEWIVWRMFLALGGKEIHNPSETRGFEIDHEFFPVSHAPGGGPDMAFEFDDFILVVEVTLTEGSRQQVAESEPVRRHVAEYAASAGKKVMGLFIAPTIDNNLACTFLERTWYPADSDEKMMLDIIPVSLGDMVEFMKKMDNREDLGELTAVREFEKVLDFCSAIAKESRETRPEAPGWKVSISSRVQSGPRRI